jgi:sugar phosphate isomerase/epimerase
MKLRSHRSFSLRVLSSGVALGLCVLPTVAAPDPVWQNLSSKRGDLPPPPGGSSQQTGAVVADFEGDGIQDFLLSFRQKPPALVWYRRTAAGWDQFVVEKDYLTIEAGGAVHDIDGDGDLDVAFGGDWQSSDVWWWENPSPDFDKNTPWKRRIIKTGGKNQHHDQVFGDFLGTGKPQLAFWNQQAATMFLAEIPDDPLNATSWPLTPILTNAKPAGVPYIEGASAFDVDADGRLDLLACDSWFKHTGGKSFKQVQFAVSGGLIFAGYFKPSKYPQVVVSPGDAGGRVRWYECTGNPENVADWRAHDLLDREVVHGHSLQLGDANRDGHLDIFVGEMAKWSEKKTERDHPEATAWVCYGDGQGGFTIKPVITGHGWHEARLADLDGDGDLDLLNKPYNWDAPRVDVWLNNGTRAGAKGAGSSASFHGPVGMQLYSLREMFGKNVPLALQTTRGFGFREVELAGTYGRTPAQFRVELLRAGLKPIASIVDYKFLDTAMDQAIADAKALGVQYLGTAGIPRAGQLTEAEARKAAADFNRFGEVLAKAGIKFFYHNHGFEFVPRGEETLFDLIVQETKPEFVTFEMDLFWTVHPGQDPVKLLKKYPNRWALMHVKDMKKGTATGKLTGSEDVRNDVVVGSGQIDVAAALKAAQEIGVNHYFIEDESPSVVEQIPQSLRYLESLAW